MKQLTDVGVLYNSLGASHVPYREIKLNESRVLSLTLFPLLSLIDLSNLEIKTVSAAERTKRSLVPQAIPDVNVTKIENIVNPVNTDLVDVNFELHKPLDSDSNTSFLNELPVTAAEKASIKPFHVISDTSENIVFNDLPHPLSADSEINITSSIHKETGDSKIVSSNIGNSEMARLIQRLTQNEHQENPIYKRSFFERLQKS